VECLALAYGCVITRIIPIMSGILKLPAVVFLAVHWVAHLSLAAQPTSPVSDLLNAPAYERTFTNHLESGEAYRRGRSESLLLRLDWFSSLQVVQFCLVTTMGQVEWGLRSTRSIKHGGRKQLEDSELDSLQQAIARLPEPPSRPAPERWLLVSGIRSNEWFTSIYDRRDIPPEVERLFVITGAPIVWEVPKVQSSAKSAARPGNWRPGYIHAFKTAAHAPVAVSLGNGRIQVWDLRQPPDQRTPDTDTFEGTGWHSPVVAVSTDGGLIAADRQEITREIYAVETATGKVRWQVEVPESEPDKVLRDLAFVGTNQLLAVRFLNSVELWDTANGHRRSVLTSVKGEHSGMQSSRDGQCLAVLLDRGNSEPAHIKIWDFAEPVSVHEIVESHPGYGIRLFAFSPDRRYLALGSGAHRGSWVLWDWAAGTKRLISLRGCSGLFSGDIVQLSWSPDGDSLVVNPPNGAPWVYDGRTWKPRAEWVFPEPGSFHLAYAWDGSLLALLGNGDLHGLDAATLQSLTGQDP
jgi:hypothetical protein